jgi:hypothetical protein
LGCRPPAGGVKKKRRDTTSLYRAPDPDLLACDLHAPRPIHRPPERSHGGAFCVAEVWSTNRLRFGKARGRRVPSVPDDTQLACGPVNQNHGAGSAARRAVWETPSHSLAMLQGGNPPSALRGEAKPKPAVPTGFGSRVAGCWLLIGCLPCGRCTPAEAQRSRTKVTSIGWLSLRSRPARPSASFRPPLCLSRALLTAAPGISTRVAGGGGGGGG